MFHFKHRVLPVILVLSFLLCFISPVPVSPFQGKAIAVTAPDLIIESITWTPQNPSIGETLYFTVTVKNNGNGPAGSFYSAAHIDDTQAYNYLANPLHEGSTVSYIFTWKAKAGDHMVSAVCDSRNDVIEINENNNNKTFAFSVLAADLVVSWIDWTPERPSINQEMTFTISVLNQGNRMATASSVVLTLDGQPMSSRNIGALEPGESTTVTYNTPAKTGEHTAEAIVDVLEQVKESNESNNYKTETYFAAMPDLVVSAITWSPINRSANENVTFTLTVKNQGSGKAAFSTLGFYIDDICQTAIFIDSLNINAASVKTVSFPVDVYEHSIKAIADITNVIVESDESNNVLTADMSSLKPDLIIESITWLPVKPIIAQGMNFKVTVKNQGTRPCGLFQLAFHVNYFNKSVQICTSLDAGATTTFDYPWITREETLSVEAIVDETNTIDEYNETNNTARANIGFSTPAPETDLSIESITCSPTVASVGDAVNINVTIKNLGPGIARPSHVAYYIDNTLLDSVYVKDMPGNTTTTVRNIIWTAQNGTHKLKVIIDCNNSVFETSETNNEKTIEIKPTAPDLIIKDITWWPTNPTAGQEVTLSLTVKNQGDKKAGSSYLTYYIDDASRGNHYVEEMEAGGVLTRTFTWKMQVTSHVFRAVIDEENSVMESQDYNNEKTVYLPASDLVLSDITCSQENPSENTTIAFNINISNQGDGPSPRSRIIYYIDGGAYASRDIDEIQPGSILADVFTWVAIAGKHELRVVADATNLFVETNESNNALGVFIFVPLTATVAVPVLVPITENITEPVTEPAPKPTTVTKVAEKTDKNAQVTEPGKTPPAEIEEAIPDIAENISETPTPDATPMWKKILLNRLLIITVAVIGIATISVLLMLRKRAGKTETEAPPQKPAQPNKAAVPPQKPPQPKQ